MSDNLFSLLTAPSRAERTALLWQGRSIRYAELRDAALHMAAELRSRGVREGDVVTLLLPNAPAFVVAYFACWYVGAVANPLNTRLGADELAGLLAHAQSRLVISGPTFSKLADEALWRREGQRCVPSGDSRLIELWLLESEDNLEVCAHNEAVGELARGASDPAVLIYTSGTTAAPKGVLLSHSNLLADAAGIASRLAVDHEDRTLCFMPLFHCNALIFSHLSSFYVSASVALYSKFSASQLWEQVERTGAHSFSCPPTVLAMLLSRTPANLSAPTGLRFVKVGAAPLAESLASAFERRFNVPLIEGYGMTEGTATTVMHDPHASRPPGTVGFALDGQRVRIAREDGAVLPSGHVGEIQIGGATVMLGYHRAPELTSGTVIDGWLRTGDLGSLDSEGYLRLAGRQKDIIIRGGENIFPAALDELLEAHPGVQEGAVYGVPDAIWGEVPVAAVVPNPGLDLHHLSEFMRGRVADFQMPTHFRLVESIPRNAVGKTQRHILKESHPALNGLQEEGQPS